MGDHSQIIVDIDAGPEDAERLGHAVLDWLVGSGIVEREGSDSALGDIGHRPGRNYRSAIEDTSYVRFLTLRTNGLAIRTGRTFFDAGENYPLELHCDICHYQIKSKSESSVFLDKVRPWCEGDDQVTFACPRCGQARPLREWRGPWQWGFGYLGLEFWNWPTLSEEFIQSVTRQLGHRTVLVRRHV